MTGRGIWQDGRAAALTGLALLYAACLVIAPLGPLAMLPMNAPFLPPGTGHLLGTDDLGRDVLSAVAQGGRTSLAVAGAATTIALMVGLLVGMIAGSARGWVDDVLMRTADIVAGLPSLLIAVVVVSTHGGSSQALAIVIGLTRWPMIARLIRIEVLVIGRTEFVLAATGLGVSRAGILLRHILPEVLTQLSTAAGIVFGGAVIAEAALSFIGLGDPSATSWGQLLAVGFAFFDRGWWIWAAPAGAIVLASGLVAAATRR